MWLDEDCLLDAMAVAVAVDAGGGHAKPRGCLSGVRAEQGGALKVSCLQDSARGKRSVCGARGSVYGLRIGAGRPLWPW